MSIDPSGRFAYVANHGSNTISAFSICGSGALTPWLESDQRQYPPVSGRCVNFPRNERNRYTK